MSSVACAGSRWLIAAMGTCLQLCLGTVYAWSYFQKLLVEQYAWTHSQVAWAFSLAICSLGLAAAAGGILLPRLGPRRLAVSGGVLFGLGHLLGAAALHQRSLLLLYVGYGILGGIGLGLGYVTPVATAAKWFPDKKGLVTGMVIMGFGFGALLMSKVLAPWLIDACHGRLETVFAWLGAIFLAATTAAGSFLRNPPVGYSPPGASLPAAPQAPDAPAAPAQGPAPALSPGFVMMWVVFFCNILAGISIISFQSPMIQDLWLRRDPALSGASLAGLGATLIAVSSLFNGVGRLFWGALSDHIGRARTFRFMLGSQIAVFGWLMFTDSPWVFAGLVCYVLLCYGGGFGTMPSFVLDRFGSRAMAAVYGAILTAWSAAGVAGPQLVAFLKDRYPQQSGLYAFGAGAAVLALGFALTMFLSDQRPAAADGQALHP